MSPVQIMLEYLLEATLKISAADVTQPALLGDLISHLAELDEKNLPLTDKAQSWLEELSSSPDFPTCAKDSIASAVSGTAPQADTLATEAMQYIAQEG